MTIQARQQRSLFSQTVSVTTDIDATPAKVWKLLTDAASFPKWNSTLVSISGNISEGQSIELVATSSDRTFRLNISDVQPQRSMVWSDGNFIFRGVRTFTLTPSGSGTRFTMSETMNGWMFPMIRPSLPDFPPIFEQYATDLKSAAENDGTAS